MDDIKRVMNLLNVEILSYSDDGSVSLLKDHGSYIEEYRFNNIEQLQKYCSTFQY